MLTQTGASRVFGVSAGALIALEAARSRPGGGRGLTWLRPGCDALEEILPSVTRRELAGLDHGGSSDKSATNPGGQPEVVAAEVGRFFAG